MSFYRETLLFNFQESNVKRALKNLFTKRNPNRIVIFPHLGLGDNLVCIGLIRAIIQRDPDKVYYYACPYASFHTISWIYKDLNNLYSIPVRERKEAIQLSGFLNAQFLPIDTDGKILKNYEEYFYSKYRIPFSMRWDDCTVSPGPQSDSLFKRLNPRGEPYILICSKQSGSIEYPLKIENLQLKKVIYVEPLTNNLYDWTRLIAGADEIHSIDTAFIHLVENFFYVNVIYPKLYYHLARPTHTAFTRRLMWSTVVY
jgi:ADP-heptose:LPS heptosyltransferase